MCFCLSGYHFFLPHNQSLQLILEGKSVPGALCFSVVRQGVPVMIKRSKVGSRVCLKCRKEAEKDHAPITSAH